MRGSLRGIDNVQRGGEIAAMKKWMNVLWNGVVGAVAGGCVGMLAMIVVLMVGMPLEPALVLCGVAAVVGLVVGLLWGARQ